MSHPDPLHIAEISDRFDVLMRQESTTYACCDYLSKWREACARSDSPNSLPQNAASGITEIWREKICEWSYEVVDYFEFNREVVAVSLGYLDRYLANRIVNKKSFQLIAMTTLYLAIKLFEHGGVAISSFTELSRGNFTVEEIAKMEITIIRELNWNLHPPTSLAFCRSFLSFFPMHIASRDVKHEIAEMMRFLCELSVCDYWFVTQKPSRIALAAVTIALEKHLKGKIGELGDFLSYVDKTSGIRVTDEDVMKCRERLWEMYSQGGYNNVEEVVPPVPREESESPVCVSGAPQLVKDSRCMTKVGVDSSFVNTSQNTNVVVNLRGNDLCNSSQKKKSRN